MTSMSDIALKVRRTRRKVQRASTAEYRNLCSRRSGKLLASS